MGTSTPHFPTIPGFEIQRLLGMGGMGMVYLARQTAVDRLVALKLIRPETMTPAALARLRVEGEALARLRHPHFVPVYAVGESGEQGWIALEYVQGPDLAEVLGGIPLPAGQAASLVCVLASALQAAHDAGIVHRDLKPGNILLDPCRRVPVEGEACLLREGSYLPRISDFGLARLTDQSQGQTRSGEILGTPEYMSPEQAQGQGNRATPASDVHALGAILYECLTGRPPFHGPTPFDTLVQVLTEPPVPLRRIRPEVPRDLEIVCLKCLRKNPAQRYSSARELAEDLGRYLRGEVIKERAPTLWEEIRMQGHQQPWLAVATRIIGLFFGLLLIAGPFFGEATPVWLAFLCFLVPLALFLRPSRRTLGVSLLGLGAGALLTWINAPRMVEPLMFPMFAAIGCGLGGIASLTARYWRRSVLETLPAALTGAFVGALAVVPVCVAQRWMTTPLFPIFFLSGGALGALAFAVGVARFLARKDQRRWQLRAQFVRPTVKPSERSAQVAETTAPFPDEPAHARQERGNGLPILAGYEMIRPLGRGGMGVVYQARERATNRLVAIKMVRPGEDLNPVARERFLAEARAAGRMRHPNLVEVYDLVEQHGRLFLVMEFIDGTSLDQADLPQPPPVEEVVRWMITLAQALHHAHRAQIIHRDLKPHNVLLDREGGLHVTDFGVARLLDRTEGMTNTGDMLGTPAYMAPEQAEGRSHEADPATDVYGLGTILYYLLTGRAPFGGSNPLLVLQKVRTEEPVPPRQFQPACPPILEAICLKCLKKDPKERYRSASGLASDLERFLTGQSTEARPFPWWRRALAHELPMRIGGQPITVALLLLINSALLGPFVLIRLYPQSAVGYLAFLLALLGLLYHDRRLRARRPLFRVPTPWNEDAPIAAVQRHWNGAITLPLQALRFPPECCSCLQPTEGVFYLPLADQEHTVALHVPYCAQCRLKAMRWRRNCVLGLTGVCLLLLGWWVVWLIRDRSDLWSLIALVLGVGVAFFLGGGLVVRMLQRSPVSGRRYSWKKATVTLRFRCTTYAERVIARTGEERKAL